MVQVIELAAWGFASEDGPAAPKTLPERSFTPASVLQPQSKEIQDAFQILRTRQDLLDEFIGLSWTLEMVDLRLLLAFQRRLAFDPAMTPQKISSSLADLLALTFAPPRELTHRWIDAETIQSDNPDLQLRPSATGWRLHGGSPFLEVTLFTDRAFLRDGYHRAYDLLQAGIHTVPAVVIRADSPDGICPTDSWFMPHDVLLGPNPPRVTDFLDPELTITYERPHLLKTIHLTITESMEPER